MLPNRDELKLFDEAIAAAKADPAKARPAMVKAFAAGEFTTDQVESWLVIKKETAPELWGATADPAQAERDAANAALAAKAFTGPGRNIGARGDLVRAVGEAEADKMAQRYGLTGIADFKTVPVAPAADDGAGDDDAAGKAKAKEKAKGEHSTNPWSPRYKGANPAEAERIHIIKTLGTKAAARMATAAGADLAGRPLRGRVA